MLNYKNFLLESKTRQKKIQKVIDKIRKNVTTFEPIIDKTTELLLGNDEESTEGLKYAVWIANQFVESFLSDIKIIYTDIYPDLDMEADSVFDFMYDMPFIKKFDNPHENESEFDTPAYKKNVEIYLDFVKKYLKTGEIDTEKKEKKFPTDTEKPYVSNIEKFIYSFDFNEYYDRYGEEIFSSVVDWLKSPLRTEQINLNELDINEAYEKSSQWHNELKATGKIENEKGNRFLILENGYYWIDLETTTCRDEGEAMGHCGNTNKGDTLLSLRDEKVEPHVTASYNRKEKTIYQMKGKGNKKPVEKYHSYIVDLLINKDEKYLINNFDSEYKDKFDFRITDLNKELFDKLLKNKPNLIYNVNNLDICKDLISKNYIKKEDFIKYLKSLVKWTRKPNSYTNNPLYFKLTSSILYKGYLEELLDIPKNKYNIEDILRLLKIK